MRRRLDEVQQRIARAGGGARPTTIVAVTKGFGKDALQAAFDAGLRDFGENYAQSLLAKAAQPLENEDAGARTAVVRWHFIGGLQRRKVAKLAPKVHLWQSVARPEEGREIARRAPGAAVLVQVNITGQAQRNGCSFADASGLVGYLVEQGLDVRGLLGMASREHPRPQFRRLAGLAAELGLQELSMGMSHDFEIAVEEGATMVRLGTALFGPRPQPLDLRR